MKVELYHASKYGNGKRVAEELSRIMMASGNTVNIHHIDEARPKEIPSAGLYIFGSPTRFGGPIGNMRRFIKKIVLPPGTKYAIFATHADEVPDKKTGAMPTQEELQSRRKTIPELDELLKEKGMVKIADRVFSVSADAMKGSLKDGWQEKVTAFAGEIQRSF